MQLPIIYDVLIILALSILVIYLCHRIKVPPIVGFILTGLLVGPHGLKLIQVAESVDSLAEIGIVLLLFSIGIEFSFKKLMEIKYSLFVGGVTQAVLTMLATFGICKMVGLPTNQSIFVSFFISLSSTAIVLKVLQERSEVDTPYGRTSLGILLFQDIITVPMMLAIPVIAHSTNISQSPLIVLGKGVAIILGVLLFAKWFVLKLLDQIVRTRSRELFLLITIAICLGIAVLTSSAGLSLALGAFLAGLIISESEYSYNALTNILPLRDLFTSFFFISIGMLLDLPFLFLNIKPVLAMTSIILVGKAIIALIAALALGYPIRTAVLIGLALSQVGEFAFVLMKTGLDTGLMSDIFYQLFLAVSVITMALTPFIMALAPRIAEFTAELPMPQKIKAGIYRMKDEHKQKKSELKDHLILIGHGITGKNIEKAAKVAKIPYIIIELNPISFKAEQQKGSPIIFGDATEEHTLEHAEVKKARVVVIAINDILATRKIAEVVRKLNPTVHVIAKTPYFKEMDSIYNAGADEVVPEDFETSIEILARVLRHYLVPKPELDKFIAEARAGGYKMFRTVSKHHASDLNFILKDIEIVTLRISQNSELVGKTMAQLDLRKKHNVTVVALRRKNQTNQTIANPSSDIVLNANDVLILLGSPSAIALVSALFDNRTASSVR